MYYLDFHFNLTAMSDSLKSQTPLRIRFEKNVAQPAGLLIEKFKIAKERVKPKFQIKQLDKHVWISIGDENQKYYSPHLHLEFEETENKNTHIRGLFGPESGLWTMFMFLHFAVAGIFIMFLAFAYSNWAMGHTFTFDIAVMSLMIFAWFALYFFARLNRHRGLPQAREIESLMEEIISS